MFIPVAFKDKGNEAYAQEDYETAVKYYSDGLAEIKDMQPLYTNRAQVNIFNLCFTMKTQTVLFPGETEQRCFCVFMWTQSALGIL